MRRWVRRWVRRWARRATIAVLAATLAGCGGGPLAVTAPAVTGPAARRCAHLVHALPHAIAGQQRRQVAAGAHEYAAAWGDPPIMLQCGVPKPQALTRFASCQQVNGVGWFVPPAQINRGPGPIDLTTIGLRPRVHVHLPADYWPPAAAMADLAKPVKAALQQTRPCV